MSMDMIIGTVVALIIMIVPLVIFFKTKDKKEPLTIWIDDDYNAPKNQDNFSII